MIANSLKIIKRIVGGNNLPVYIIFHEPLVLICYFEDFISHRESILRALEGRKAYLLFQFGWQAELKDRVAEITREAQITRQLSPNLEFFFLCNSKKEERIYSEAGFNAIFCHQNAFIDENNYKIHNTTPKYDSIYIARITPFKRHNLAKDIVSLKLIGDHSATEKQYFDEVMNQLSHAQWERKVFSPFISRSICEAHCGLCLSAEEGAMFVSAEYLLSGRPVVSTANVGGRDEMFGPGYCYQAEDNSQSVLEGVLAMKACAVSPAEIRLQTLQRFQPHRTRLIELLQGICNRESVYRSVVDEWPIFFTHKFALRRFVGPQTRMTRLLKRVS